MSEARKPKFVLPNGNAEDSILINEEGKPNYYLSAVEAARYHDLLGICVDLATELEEARIGKPLIRHLLARARDLTKVRP